MSFQIGGALPPDNPHYVTRQADHDLYNRLTQGQFCYVFNARQMGKTSLQFRISKQLQQEDFKIANLDLANVGTTSEQDQWYATLIYHISQQLNLNFSLSSWWKEKSLLSVSAKWKAFLEEILLTQIKNRIVIFIDEIDAVLNLDFSTDDFFAVIRSCYNDRGKNLDYNRLTFCLLGVTRPSYLIKNQDKTPFNIGQAIELTGFTFQEAKIPLTKGLTPYLNQPEKTLQEILSWTGGQPFLTQKICKLVTENAIKAYTRNPNVEQIIQQFIIQNWRNNDDPIHLNIIEKRILYKSQPVIELVTLYQKILLKQTIPSQGNLLESELRLSGLVVKVNDHLQVYNKIYQTIFNQDWIDDIIEQQLSSIRPKFYIEAFQQWFASDKKDSQFLLSKEQLEEFDQWINKGQELSKQDLEFLHASVKYQEKQAQQQKWRLTLLSGGLILALITSFLGIQWYQVRQRYQQQLAQNLMSLSQELEPEKRRQKISLQLEALRRDQNLAIPLSLYRDLAKFPYLTQTFKHSEQVNVIAVSPDKQTFLTGSLDGNAYLWNIKGELIDKFEHNGEMITSVAFSEDGSYLATASIDGVVKIWSKEGKLRHIFQHKETVNAIAFTPNDNYIVTVSSDHHWYVWDIKTGKIKLSSQQLPKNVIHTDNILTLALSTAKPYFITGSLDKTAKLWNIETGENILTINHQNGINMVLFSHNGQFVVTASADGIVNIVNLDTQEKRQLKHPTGVLGVRFSHNDQQLATISRNNVNLWKIEDIFNSQDQILWQNNLANTFPHTQLINKVIFSNNDQLLITVGDDNKGKVWDLNNHRLLYQLSHDAPVVDLISLNNSENLTASWDQTVRLWNLQKTPIKATTFSSEIQQFSFSLNDNKMIISDQNKGVYFLKMIESKVFKTSIKLNEENSKIILSPHGNYVAVIDNEIVQLWQKENNNLWNIIATLTHFDEVEYLQFSPDETYLVTASDEWKTRRWQIQPNLKLEDAKIMFKKNVQDVKISPDSQIVGLVNQDNKILLFNAKTHREINKFSSEILEFSPDGQFMLTYDQEKLCLIKLQDFQQLNCQSFSGDKFQGIEWSQTGNYFVIIYNKQRLSLGRIERNKFTKIKEIDMKKPIEQVQLGSQGEYLAILTEDHTVQIRNVQSPAKIELYIQSEHPIKTFRFLTTDLQNNLVIITPNDVLRLPLWSRQKLLLEKVCDGDSPLCNPMDFSISPSSPSLFPSPEICVVLTEEGTIPFMQPYKSNRSCITY